VLTKWQVLQAYNEIKKNITTTVPEGFLFYFIDDEFSFFLRSTKRSHKKNVVETTPLREKIRNIRCCSWF